MPPGERAQMASHLRHAHRRSGPCKGIPNGSPPRPVFRSALRLQQPYSQQPGVECASSTSSGVMSAEMSANSGVLK
jgi:hypothetical protein